MAKKNKMVSLPTALINTGTKHAEETYTSFSAITKVALLEYFKKEGIEVKE